MKKSQQLTLFKASKMERAMESKPKQAKYNNYTGWSLEVPATGLIMTLKNKRTMKWEQKSWENSQKALNELDN